MNVLTRLAVVALTLFSACTAQAQQTATSFTYQGRLTSGGAGVDVKHDIAFTLYDNETAGAAVSDTLVKTLTPTDGLFTTELDFGAEALIGTYLWLEIEVRPIGGAPEVLSPRQRVTPAPAAVQSGAVTTDGFWGILDPNGVTTETAPYIDNTGAFQSTVVSETFWQSFRTTKPERLEFFEILVKRPAGAPVPDATVRIGEGGTGIRVGSLDGEWAGGSGGLAILRYAARDTDDPILLEANQTYSVYLQNLDTNLISFSKGLIVDPNAGRSSTGPNDASDFSIEVASEVEPAAFFSGPDLTVSNLVVGKEDTYGGRISAIGRDPSFGIVDTDSRSFFGGGEEITLVLRLERTEVPFTDSQWVMDATPNELQLNYGFTNDRPDFVFRAEPLARGWLMSDDIGLTEAALEGEDLIIEEADAVLGLYSNEGGGFGSTLALGQVDETGAFLDKWSISRRTTSATNQLQFAFGTNTNYGLNTVNFALRTDGSAFLRGALTQNSTATEKHDIETLTGAIETLLKLRGVSYRWNQTDNADIGFIAEEMAGVLPEIVGFDETGAPIGIDYGRLTALIVEATKAQQRQLDEQAGLIEALTRRLEALEARD